MTPIPPENPPIGGAGAWPAWSRAGEVLSWREKAGYFLLGAGLALLMALPVYGELARGSLVNPDSYMRLVRLRDMLAEHKVLDVVARDGSGLGTVIAWSHLLDAVLLLLSAPLRLFTPGPQALHWGALALGPLSAGLLGVALAWALAPFTSREWRWMAPLLAGLSLYVVGYALPGVVHHHIPIAVTIALTLGYAVRAASGSRAGVGMGLWAALGLWLTPETMPFTLAAFAGVGVAWLSRPGERAFGRALLAGGSAFLLLVGFAVIIDPPHGGYSEAEIDRLSLVYVVLAAVVFAIGGALFLLDRTGLPAAWRSATGAGLAVLGIGVWLACFPAVAKGPDGLLSPAEATAFFGSVAEMQPLRSAAAAWRNLLGGGLAVAVLAAAALRTRSWLWAYAAVMSLIPLALGAAHLRFLTYPALLAAAVVPLAMTAFARPAGRLAVVALFFAAPYAAQISGSSAAAPATRSAASCAVDGATPLLAPYAGQIVLADVNDTPELLYRTPILTVGSVYHTGIAGFMRLRAAWRSTPGNEVPQAVQRTGATLVLFCPGEDRSGLVSDLPPDTLWDKLSSGQIPPWLERVAADPSSGYVLYRLRQRP